MVYNGVADRYEFYAGSFTLDFYLQALRRFVKLNALSGKLGQIEQAPIDPFYLNRQPLALMLGESNRLHVRYPLIKELLEAYKNNELNSDTDFVKTKYFGYLYSNFKPRSFIKRYRGKKSCIIKTKRVLKICDWLEQTNGEFSGLSSFISGESSSQKRMGDYPLAIKIGGENGLDSFVQLDGSHRRSVAAFIGQNTIDSLVIDIEVLNRYIVKCDDEYIQKYWPILVELLNSLGLIDFRNS